MRKIPVANWTFLKWGLTSKNKTNIKSVGLDNNRIGFLYFTEIISVRIKSSTFAEE